MERSRRAAVGIDGKWAAITVWRVRGELYSFSPPVFHIEVLDNGEYREDHQDSKDHIDYTGLSIGLQRNRDGWRECAAKEDEQTKRAPGVHRFQRESRDRYPVSSSARVEEDNKAKFEFRLNNSLFWNSACCYLLLVWSLPDGHGRWQTEVDVTQVCASPILNNRSRSQTYAFPERLLNTYIQLNSSVHCSKGVAG